MFAAGPYRVLAECGFTDAGEEGEAEEEQERIGAAFAGLAGGLYASQVGFIDPALFTVGQSIMMYLMVVVGGPGYFLGPLLGAAVGVILPDAPALLGLVALVAPIVVSGNAVVALASGEIQAMTATIGSVAPHLPSNRVRALGVTSAYRLKPYPDIPAIGESIKGYEFVAWIGAFMASGTPKPLVDRMNAVCVNSAVALPSAALPTGPAGAVGTLKKIWLT